ncbi:hypothetical protein ATCV1_z424R [Acanthocystis turfacea chlorella virus 1]|uniref:Uncharacterized protein z424R n=1 Tax=Chlorovirus heliozoae TaxID=322019 RepID=A7K934_9PHYC|nr:hypothetical protein ATCV1_z424R [Acanthocystis turfacea chlorella virus 1]ABT16558.1 hypothetical protein ATCV1_z424R [Acanthocystis turfacea chlorella virus 1]
MLPSDPPDVVYPHTSFMSTFHRRDTFSSIFSSSGWACLSKVPSGAKGSPALLNVTRRVGEARGNCLFSVQGYPMAIDLAKDRILLHLAIKSC